MNTITGSKPFQSNENLQVRRVSPDERAKASHAVNEYIKLSFKAKALNVEIERLKNKGI
jgi:hypothetical protein